MTHEQLNLIFSDRELRLLKKSTYQVKIDYLTSNKLDKINEVTGQENDMHYWAYLLENWFNINKNFS